MEDWGKSPSGLDDETWERLMKRLAAPRIISVTVHTHCMCGSKLDWVVTAENANDTQEQFCFGCDRTYAWELDGNTDISLTLD